MSYNQNQNNYSDQSKQRQKIQWTNQNSKQVHVAGAKRGKMRASNSRLVSVLLLIGWQGGTTTKQSRNYFRQRQKKISSLERKGFTDHSYDSYEDD